MEARQLPLFRTAPSNTNSSSGLHTALIDIVQRETAETLAMVDEIDVAIAALEARDRQRGVA